MMTFIFIGMAGVFALMTIATLAQTRWARRLPELAALSGTTSMMAPVTPTIDGGSLELVPAVRCSVVIAARDEEARIEQTLRRLLGLEGVELEIIVVDDRSKDRTPEILQPIAAGDPRVQVRRVDVLPEGWLGKCHACHVGAMAATGDWILFTDADCWLRPDVLVRAIRVAEREGADHVTLAAGTVLASPLARAWYLLFLMGLAGWFAGVNRDRPKAHVGIGAFNLVRADAYRACGGYEALRLTVVDDIKLGLLLRRAGRRTRAFLGADDVECHWGSTVGSLVKIMEKNHFAVLDYRLGLVAAGAFAVSLVVVILALGLASGTAAGLAAAFSPLGLILPASVLARRVGWSWPSALFVPLMFPVFFYSLVNSTVVTLRQGGVRWRNTVYPLAVLRAGNVQ